MDITKNALKQHLSNGIVEKFNLDVKQLENI